MIRWNLLKCVLIILVMFHPLCIFAEKTLVVATSADPGHLNPGITTAIMCMYLQIQSIVD